jgi:hypothetical protein
MEVVIIWGADRSVLWAYKREEGLRARESDEKKERKSRF